MKLPAWLRTLVEPAARKVARMSPEDMLRWADIAGGEMRRSMSDYTRTRDRRDLAEFERGLAVLVAMDEELRRRTG